MTTTSTTAAPARAQGLELLGPLSGSGYRAERFLVRRADGQTLQITTLLYRLLESMDGHKDWSQLAAELGAAIGKTASADDVQHLVTTKLAPLGMLAGTEAPEQVASNPLLALRWKFVVSSPAATRRLTAPFAVLFHPVVLWPVLAAFVGVCWFVLVDKGLASATRSAFDSPGLLLAVFALTVLSAGLHELGHAAACRYGGATPGVMGAGLYLVWPAFYTNVDDTYRLGRKDRLRVDLGGLYFNALIAVVVTGLWWATGQDALLLGVATQLLQMARQLAPVVRADGYHILADLTGVPDLFAHLGPTVGNLLPRNWGRPSVLTRKARIIVSLWVLVVVPVLVSMLATAVLLFPRLVSTAWVSGHRLLSVLGRDAESVDLLGMGLALLQLLALLLPVVGTSLLITRLVRTAVTSGARRTEGRPLARAAAMTAGAVVLAALAWAWWPSGQYTPVRADERGTLPALLQRVSNGEVVPSRSLATRQLALVMVPRGAAASDHPVLVLYRDKGALRTVLTSGSGSRAAGAAFPFALPKAPGPGDTQALAVNDKDASTVYDVSYALVTITDGAPVTRSNTAYALASCRACTTVAVSFQVVLVVGQSHVVTPVNAAVAANSGCVQCVTTALADQLVLTLRSAPSAAVSRQLTDALHGLDGLQGLDTAALISQVAKVQSDVLGILQGNGLLPDATTQPTGSPVPTASAFAVATASPSGTPAASTSATPEPTVTPSPSASPTPAPTSQTTQTSQPSPSATP